MSEVPRHWRMQTIYKERYNLTGKIHLDGSVSLFHEPARPKFFPEVNRVPTNNEDLVIESTAGAVLIADSGVIFQRPA